MNYSDNAKKVYERLYLKNDESIEDCHKRVAKFLAESVNESVEFERVLNEQKFRVNTPCIANAGVKENGNLCACFILDLEDSMHSIINMWGICARIYEGGGGAGIPITNLREKNANISTGGKASGPLSYLEVIQSISDQVKSGGRARRAANLISFKYDHPDTEKIIECKNDKKSFSSMNLSMLVDNDFMSNIDSNGIYNVKSPTSGVVKENNIKDLWNKVIENAWLTGDPGLLFYDRINQDNPFKDVKDIVCANPCGEVLGLPWTSCVLGHINLNKYIDNGSICYDALKEDIAIYVLMLNRIIDKTSHPSPEFKVHMEKYRPIGLGIMGLADILIKLGVPYGSKKACEIVSELMKTITDYAFRSSIDIASRNLTKTKINTVLSNDLQSPFYSYVRRFCNTTFTNIANSTVTCIAPTGSTSISADCSYGMEPLFALVWTKQLDNDEKWFFTYPYFEQACRENDIILNNTLMSKITENKGSIKGLKEFPESMQSIFVTAHDLNWKERIDMQAAAQEYTTMSISSTVNLPNSATKKDVSEIYKYAWKKGLKGITVYRDGCLDNQPVDFGGKKKEKPDVIKKRPDIRKGKTVEINCPSGKLYITGNYWGNRLQEVFISMSNQDTRTNHLLNSYGRLLSRSLQCGVPIDSLIDTMRGGGGEVFWANHSSLDHGVRTSGLIDTLALMIDSEFLNDYKKHESIKEDKGQLDRCPQCGKYTLRRDVGCRGGMCINPDCLYSNCS